MNDYWGFVNELREDGIELADAREAYRDVRDELERSLTVDDAEGRVVDDVLSDLGYEIEYEEEAEVEEPFDVDMGYDLDPGDPDDEWLDYGEEIEVTGELAYEEGE
ncbi:MAG: hypothetical protein GY906_22930 [bacterium]|nr:hypothetical protein [bacterium]